MGNIKIKKNISISSDERSNSARFVKSRGREGRWPLKDLKVDDGFEVDVSESNAVRTSIQHFQRWYPGLRFMTRIVGKKIIVKRTA